MLFSHEEYHQMFLVEEQLWWYKILHEKVLKTIQGAGFNKNAKILDMGCGTGGMISYLIKNGYTNIEGFDYAESAVSFSISRNLNVKQLNIDLLSQKYEENQFDIIICNDVFYSLSNGQISTVLKSVKNMLRKNGIFISNNNAFKVFRGIHDYVLGGKQRFKLSDLNLLNQNSGLEINKHSYWSFFLSPAILIVRIIQRLKMKLNLVDLSNQKSDVELPSKIVNNLFYRIVKIEEALIKTAPFGSSLFTVFSK
jgi:predicted TPR repeat methyltransferase